MPVYRARQSDHMFSSRRTATSLCPFCAAFVSSYMFCSATGGLPHQCVAFDYSSVQQQADNHFCVSFLGSLCLFLYVLFSSRRTTTSVCPLLAAFVSSYTFCSAADHGCCNGFRFPCLAAGRPQQVHHHGSVTVDCSHNNDTFRFLSLTAGGPLCRYGHGYSNNF